MKLANGRPDLKTGSYKDSKVGVNVVKEGDVWYKEGKTPTDFKKIGKLATDAKPAGFFTTYVFGTENPLFKTINAIVPSAASGAAGHDIWVEVMKFGIINTAITAPPYLILNACAASPSLCSSYINYKRNQIITKNIIMLKNKIGMLILLSLLMLNNCAIISVREEGVAKKPYKYRYYNGEKHLDFEIDGLEFRIAPLGYCGFEMHFFAFALPIPLFPVEFHMNRCSKKRFVIPAFKPLHKKVVDSDYSKISYQLKYDDVIYETIEENGGSFTIPDFDSFKKAQDKTLIIHKKRDDGTVITKEIPFDWKYNFYI